VDEVTQWLKTTKTPPIPNFLIFHGNKWIQQKIDGKKLISLIEPDNPDFDEAQFHEKMIKQFSIIEYGTRLRLYMAIKYIVKKRKAGIDCL